MCTFKHLQNLQEMYPVGGEWVGMGALIEVWEALPKLLAVVEAADRLLMALELGDLAAQVNRKEDLEFALDDLEEEV